MSKKKSVNAQIQELIEILRENKVLYFEKGMLKIQFKDGVQKDPEIRAISEPIYEVDEE
jgi:hypothetical protein